MLAIVTRNEVLDIGVERAMLIAKPLSDVSRYYPIKTDGPAMSIFKLVAGLAAVNFPILLALQAQRAQAKAERAQRATVAATPDVIVPGATETRPQYDFSAAN